MKRRISIIEDEASLRQSLKIGFSDLGYQIKVADQWQTGYDMIHSFQPHLLFLDVRLPDANGVDLIKIIKKEFPDIQIVIMTAYGNTSSIVQAIKNGAIDYLNKPFEWDEIELLTNKIFNTINLQQEVQRYKWENENRSQSHETFIGDSKQMKALLQEITLAAPTDATILIEGETGTGKERIAHIIHKESQRCHKPFMVLNCGAIPSHLLESELFGYEKGAFTGAFQTKKGLIEWADEGTLFLDEIGELPLDVQVKLLRFLEERTFKRVGGYRDIEVNIRVIAATNRSLEKGVKEGNFRADLFYRLHVVPLNVPPLRKREDDIVELCKFYLHYFSKQLGKKVPTLLESDLLLLKTYTWPGNVRELRNIVERYIILYESGVRIAALIKNDWNPEHTDKPQSSTNLNIAFKNDFSLEKEIEDMEKKYIRQALHETRWNISKSAELLGLSRYTLQRRIEKYQL